MRSLSTLEYAKIHGGCDNVNDCASGTLAMLNQCTMAQMNIVNAVFKSVLLNDAYQGADEDTLIAALIDAIQSATI